MTGADVRKMTLEEIDVELKRLRASVYSLRTKAVTEKIEDNSVVLKTRRDIARLLTERTARANAGKKPAAKPAVSGRRSVKPTAKPGSKNISARRKAVLARAAKKN